MPPPPPGASARAGRLSPEQSRRSELFYDRKILRAGWGILLFVVVVLAAVAAQTLLLLRFSHTRDVPHAALVPRDALPGIILAVAITVATWVLSTREQRTFAQYGLRPGHALRLLLGGLLAGAALLSALVLLMHRAGLLVFRGQVLFGVGSEWRLGLTWLAYFALGAYVEEMAARGYLQYTLTRGAAWVLRHYFAAASGVQLGFWCSGVFMSVLFALAHLLNRGETALGLLNAGLFGLLMVFSLWRTGSLWWALGFHTTWDWAQSFLWGVPDSALVTRDHVFLTEPVGQAWQSGGITGPEGSVYTTGTLLAGFALVMLLRKRQAYPELWVEAAEDARDTDNMMPDPGGFPVRG